MEGPFQKYAPGICELFSFIRCNILIFFCCWRPTNIYLHHPAQWTKSTRQHDPVTQESMVWPMWHPRQLLMLWLRYKDVVSAILCQAHDFSRLDLLSVLQLSSLGWTQTLILNVFITVSWNSLKMLRERGSWQPACMVESVMFNLASWFNHDNQQLLYSHCSQIFPGYSSARCPLAKDSALAKIKEQWAARKAAAHKTSEQLTN